MFANMTTVEKGIIIICEMNCIRFVLQPGLCETSVNIFEYFGNMVLILQNVNLKTEC